MVIYNMCDIISFGVCLVVQKKLYWFIIVIFFCSMIFFLTSSSFSTSMGTEQIFHKYNWYARRMAHISLFGLLAISAQRVLRKNDSSYLLAWLFVTLYGLSDEWHQSLVPYRTSKMSDVVLDSAAAFFALTIEYLYFYLKPNNKIL